MEESASAPPPPPTSTEQQPISLIPEASSVAAASPVATVSPPNPDSEPQSKPSSAEQSEQSDAPQTRPAFNTRPWQQASYTHFALPSSHLPASAPSTSSSVTATPAPRGAVAIGVPAHNPSVASPSSSQPTQIRQPLQGMGSGTAPASSIWPAGSPSNQLRPPQSSLRPQTSPSSQSPALQPQNQQWQAPGIPGKPPLPTMSVRPTQQRSHLPQQLNSPMQQQSTSSSQQASQSLAGSQPQEHYGQQFTKQSVAHPPAVRGAVLGSQRLPSGMSHSGGKAQSMDAEESTNRIVSKRSIKDIARQIDPSENLDPEVEGILMDIAEEYLESIVTFGCSLAKHRKSTTLEAKDILLHVERNWNMTLPGFSGDEIKTYKKPVVAEIHKERLAVIKKSIMVADKNSGAPSGGGAKSQLAKGLPASSGHQ